jgi:hypothetical protein
MTTRRAEITRRLKQMRQAVAAKSIEPKATVHRYYIRYIVEQRAWDALVLQCLPAGDPREEAAAERTARAFQDYQRLLCALGMAKKPAGLLLVGEPLDDQAWDAYVERSDARQALTPAPAWARHTPSQSQGDHP